MRGEKCGLGVFGLFVAFYLYHLVKGYSGGEGKVAEIAEAIHDSAMVFMHREYSVLAVFVLVVVALLALSLGVATAGAFILGAVCSAGAGYIGMSAATRANVRTIVAVHQDGAAAAFTPRAPTSAPTWWVRSKPASPRMTRATPG